MMREIDRLRALEMRVARQRPVEVRFGGRNQCSDQPLNRGDAVGGRLAREEDEVGGYLVVA